MTFTLNVNIGLTPQLAGFLSAVLGSQPQPAQVKNLTAVVVPEREAIAQATVAAAPAAVKLREVFN